MVPIFFATLLGASVLVIGLIGGVGKGNRCAPCDALVADIAPPKLRGAAFGLRQSLDTVGAVVWCVVIPGAMAVALLAFGVKKPQPLAGAIQQNPIRRASLGRFPPAYGQVVGIGAVVTLAHLCKAFVVLPSRSSGVPLALVPLVMVAMSLVYALWAAPFGRLSDRVSHKSLWIGGLALLIVAELIVAS